MTVLCQHCERPVSLRRGVWVDLAATGDDSVWRETCDANDTFTAEHEPKLPTPWTASAQATSYTRKVQTIKGVQRHRGYVCKVARRDATGRVVLADGWQNATFAKKRKNAVQWAEKFARSLNKTEGS